MSDAAYRMYAKDAGGAGVYAFKCDTAALRGWLNRRKSSLEDVRRRFEPLWKDVRRWIEPSFGKALLDRDDRDASASEREDGDIINSEPRLCVERYAAGMQSGITNEAQAWCSIVAKNVDDETARDRDVNEWCASATRAVLDAFRFGNFYATSNNVYPHGALFGTSCMMVLRGDEPGDVHFHLIDEGDYWIAEDRFGEVTVLMRRMSMTLSQAADEFMAGRLPETWRRRIEEGREEERVTVWNLVCPNDGSSRFADVPRDRPWASVYWVDGAAGGGNDGILDVRSYTYKPMAVMRQRNCGSVYGKGIGETSLPDCKELQKLEEIETRMIANEAMPPMLAPSSMKGVPINMYPGGTTFYDGIGGGSAPVQRLFETREGIGVVDEKIRTITDRIGRFWYNDLFAMMLQVNQANRSQRTATEVSELAGEKVTLLGPVLTQMDAFLNDVVDAVFMILLSDGVIPEAPAPLRLGQMQVSVEYTSTIHSEMKAALKMRAVNMLVQMLAMLAQAEPAVKDKVDFDKIIDEVCAAYPAAAAFVRNSKEVAAIREARDRQQQEIVANQQMAELAKTAGSNVKSLSEARVGNGNALDAIMGGLS